MKDTTPHGLAIVPIDDQTAWDVWTTTGGEWEGVAPPTWNGLTADQLYELLHPVPEGVTATVVGDQAGDWIRVDCVDAHARTSFLAHVGSDLVTEDDTEVAAPRPGHIPPWSGPGLPGDVGSSV